MNTYPAELVAQLQPCVHVSGLVGARDERAAAAPVHPAEAHAALAARLADALRTPRTRVWAPPRGGPRVRVLLVDYAHTLPPAKVRAGARAANDVARRALAALPPRSPLSPLFPGGPLFPDGIIAPAWVRKHTEHVPCAHVAFHCLPAADDHALGHDIALIEALGEAKAALTPRGIRLLVVLLCAPAPSVDARVAHIRRAAALDGRGSLFVLSTTADADVPVFVATLRAALSAVAAEYYKERARHVRRNRARYPPPPSVVQPVLAAASAAGYVPARTEPAVLAPAGWHVRTNYKLGALAELQGELAEAHTHYADAYAQLVQTCLGDSNMLAPRTRRWAEAKVLADTLSFKLVKLALYRGNARAARAQFDQHVTLLAERCAGWGIGPSTSEFWAWLAKQYQALADLVREARAPADERAWTLAPADARLLDDGLLRYHAALCTMERMRHAGDARAELTPLIAEHLGAAYDVFRTSDRTRLAHMAAARMAVAYSEGGPPDVALRFLERTLRWYRRGGWHVLRFVLVLCAARAAVACNDSTALARYALELHQAVPPSLDAARRAALADIEHRARLLDTQGGESTARGADDAPLDPATAAGLFHVRAVFACAHAQPHAEVPFQVAVWTARGADEVPIEALRVYMQGRSEPLVHVAQRPADASVTDADVGTVSIGGATAQAAAPCAASPLLVTGALTVGEPGTLAFTHVVATVRTLRGDKLDVLVDVARRAPREWVVRGQRPLPLPRGGGEARAVLVRPPDVRDLVHFPPQMLSGEVVALSVAAAPGMAALLVALPSDAVQAGAALLDDAAPHQLLQIPQVAPTTIYLRAPQTTGAFRVRLAGLADGGGEVRGTRREVSVGVAPAFGVRVHLQWLRDCGRLTTEVCYVGDGAVLLDDALIDVAGAEGAAADAPLGVERGALWESRDAAVWVTQLRRARTDAKRDTHARSALVLRWRRTGASDHWLSETRLALASLAPPTAPAVHVDVCAPARGALYTPLEARVAVTNTNAHVADVLVEVDTDSDACLLAGVRRHAMRLLLPHESRAVTLTYLPTRRGALALPAVRAWDMAHERAALPVHRASPSLWVE